MVTTLSCRMRSASLPLQVRLHHRLQLRLQAREAAPHLGQLRRRVVRDLAGGEDRAADRGGDGGGVGDVHRQARQLAARARPAATRRPISSAPSMNDATSVSSRASRCRPRDAARGQVRGHVGKVVVGLAADGLEDLHGFGGPAERRLDRGGPTCAAPAPRSGRVRWPSRRGSGPGRGSSRIRGFGKYCCSQKKRHSPRRSGGRLQLADLKRLGSRQPREGRCFIHPASTVRAVVASGLAMGLTYKMRRINGFVKVGGLFARQVTVDGSNANRQNEVGSGAAAQELLPAGRRARGARSADGRPILFPNPKDVRRIGLVDASLMLWRRTSDRP